MPESRLDMAGQGRGIKGLYSLCDKASYRQIPQSVEAASLG